MQRDDYNFILYIFHATILHSQRIKTNLMHNTTFYLQSDLQQVWSDLLTIFTELYAVMFKIKFSHVVTMLLYVQS